MDKQERIRSLTGNSQEQLLLARIYDRLLTGERKNIPAATCFLTGRERLLALTMTARMGLSGVRAFGGPEGAERQLLCYIPDYYDPEEYLTGEDSPIAALRAEISPYDAPTHRDFLGSLLGQGLKREVLGDIYPAACQCDFLVLREIAPYLLRQMTAVGRARITLSRIPLSQVRVPPQKRKLLRDTVASLRLDSVMASGFQMGRGKAQTYISAGKTEVNHVLVTKPDREIQSGDIITARGLGKLRVAEAGGLTKKGRIPVTLEKYL